MKSTIGGVNMIVTSEIIKIGRTTRGTWLYFTWTKIIAFHNPDFRIINISKYI